MRILFAIEAISDKYFVPEITTLLFSIVAVVIGFSGSWFEGSKIAEV